MNPQCDCSAGFTLQNTQLSTEQLYLSDIILQLVVLLNVEACPFHPLVEEQQILPVSGVGINVLLQVTETRSQSCV